MIHKHFHRIAWFVCSAEHEFVTKHSLTMRRRRREKKNWIEIRVYSNCMRIKLIEFPEADIHTPYTYIERAYTNAWNLDCLKWRFHCAKCSINMEINFIYNKISIKSEDLYFWLFKIFFFYLGVVHDEFSHRTFVYFTNFTTSCECERREREHSKLAGMLCHT